MLKISKMKLFLASILLNLIIFKICANGLQLSSVDLPNVDKSTENNKNMYTGTKFEASLKKFLKDNNSEENNDDTFGKKNHDFIRKQMLSELYSNFIVDVVNNNVMEFLDNLNPENSEKNEYQIELEESCSPFFCEKIMIAKEVEPSSMKNVNHANTINDDLTSNEKKIKMHDANSDQHLVNNLESINENYKGENEKELDAYYSKLLDGNEETEKLFLTDGNNLYILEEITKNDKDMDDNNTNKSYTEQEIKMHIPTENIDKNEGINKSYTNEDVQEHKPGDNNFDKNIDSDYKYDTNELNENEFDDSIFEMSEEDLSKKIFDEIKMNNEDKVQCYDFSNNENKCNDYKKCTFVNIDNKDVCFLDYNYMMFLKNNNCTLQSKSSLLSISKDLLENEIISRQMFQLLRNSNNINFICDTITYSFLTNVVDNTDYEQIFS